MKRKVKKESKYEQIKKDDSNKDPLFTPLGLIIFVVIISFGLLGIGSCIYLIFSDGIISFFKVAFAYLPLIVFNEFGVVTAKIINTIQIYKRNNPNIIWKILFSKNYFSITIIVLFLISLFLSLYFIIIIPLSYIKFCIIAYAAGLLLLFAWK